MAADDPFQRHLSGGCLVRDRHHSDVRAVTDAQYTIEDANGSHTVIVDQTMNGSRWYVLGYFPFNAGTTGRVTLNNHTGNRTPRSRNVIADAVRFQSAVEHLNPPDPPTYTLVATFTESSQTVLGGITSDTRSGSFADIDNDGDLDMLIQPTRLRHAPAPAQQPDRPGHHDLH